MESQDTSKKDAPEPKKAPRRPPGQRKAPELPAEGLRGVLEKILPYPSRDG